MWFSICVNTCVIKFYQVDKVENPIHFDKSYSISKTMRSSLLNNCVISNLPAQHKHAIF